MIKIYKVAHVHVGNNVLRPTIDSHDPPPRALKLKHRINDIDRRREREREEIGATGNRRKKEFHEKNTSRGGGGIVEGEKGRKSAEKELGWIKAPRGEKEISGIKKETMERKRRRRNSSSRKNNVGPRKKRGVER